MKIGGTGVWLATGVTLAVAFTARPASGQDEDWASLGTYREANAALPPPGPGESRVVFYGNSITEAWAPYFPTMFPGKPYVGRGISGQTTPQMLVRFRQDVIALNAAVVVILAGTNDIAGNTGPSTLSMIEDNLTSMVELARANGIAVVLCSVLPASDYPWHPGLAPGPKIVALNTWMRRYADHVGVVYLDYHSAMVGAGLGLRAELSADGVHPNEAGYGIMAPMAEAAIAEALNLNQDRSHDPSSDANAPGPGGPPGHDPRRSPRSARPRGVRQQDGSHRASGGGRSIGSTRRPGQ